MKLTLNFLLAFLLLSQTFFAQEKTIKGIVSDNEGFPLPGVSISVKGTTSGTQTDIDGKFSINAGTTQILVFSYLGMKTQELPATSTILNVKLKNDAQELEGVVVTTALGIKREKKSLGYATQKLEGDDVNRSPSTNFVNSMSGKVAGLQIKNNNNLGGSTNVVVRGYKSIGFNNQALFVIDGVPVDNNEVLGNTSAQKQAASGYDYGNAASDINPADIESVNVLKGAAATALYGSRAANGAIMITTKKGREQSGLGVTLNSSISVGSIDKSTFAKYQDQYGQGYFPSFRGGFDINGDGNNDDVVRTNHDASFGPAYDSSKLVYGWDSFVPESPYYKTARPWQNAKNGPIKFFQTPIVNTNTVSVSAGNDKGAFNLSYTNLNSTGLMPNSEQKKNSFLGNASYKLTDKLTATFFANYVNTATKGRNGTGYNGNLVAGFRQWWGTSVDILELRDIYIATGKNYSWNANSPTNTTPAFWNNPYFQSYENFQSDTRSRFLGNTSINYKVRNWLDITTRVSVDTYTDFQEERRSNGSYAGDPFGIARSNEESGYQRLNRNYSEFNYDLMFNFNTDLSESFNLKGIAGINIRRQKVDQILASTSGGLYVPNLFALTNSVNTVEKPVETMSNKGINGYYLSASLGFKDYFYLDATLRRDVASTLPKQNNEYYYPSLSGSFVFSNAFEQNWMTLGKIRLGYAEVGNDAPFAKIIDTYTSISPFGTSLYSVPSIRNNPDLKSERTKSWEAGLELQLADRRIGLDLSVYKTNTINQIVDIPVSEATGYTRLFKNVGNIQNEGIEATLTLVPIKSENFTWTMTTNWAKNKNKVKDLAPGITNYQLGSFQGGVSVNATVGQPYGTIQGSDYVYLNGKRVVDETSGMYQISSTNDNIIGNFTPDWTGGMNNLFQINKISVSFLIDVQKGGDVFSLDRWYGEGDGLYRNTVYNNDLGNPVRNSIADGGGHILPGVLPDGSTNTIRIEANDGTVGSFGYLGAATKDYIYDASYVKLREVTLGYTFDKKVLNGLFQELYFGLSGTNLWIIHKNIPDSDPEAGLSAGNLQGFQSGPLPTTRTIALNLKAKF